MIDVADKWDYTPPTVTLKPVEEDGVVVAQLPDPPFGHDWPPLQTLQHLAALIEGQTGQRVRVTSHEPTYEGQDVNTDEFDVLTTHWLGGPAPFEVTYAWLSGFQAGVGEKTSHDDKKTTL